LTFVNKNWPNDFRIDCKFPSNLLELFERDVDLEEELEVLKGEFENDEFIEV